MSRWTTVILALLLFAGLAVVIFVGTPAAPVAPVPALFLEFSRDDAKSLEVRSGASTIRFERDSKDRERWRVRAGAEWVRASSGEVEDLLNDLSRITPKQRFGAAEVRPDERKRWGMEAPGVTVLLGFEGRELRAAFGTELLEKKNTYAEKEPGGDIYVVPSATVEKMRAMTVDSFREKRLVGFSAYEAKELEVRRADGMILRAEKVSGGSGTTWEVLVPYKGGAEPVKFAEVLGRVLDVEVLEFVADPAPDPDKYGFAAPRAEVKVRRDGREAPVALQIGKEAGPNKYYLREVGEPSVYVVSRQLPQAIEKLDPASLRDRNVLRIGWARLESIAFVHPEQPWKLLRVLERWDVEKPERCEADVPRVDAFLTLLRELEAVKFLDGESPEKHGLATADAAAARLELRGVDESGTRTLLLGKKDSEGGVPVRLLPPPGSKEETPVAVVAAGFLDRLLEGWLSFRGLEVLHCDLDEVRGIVRKQDGAEESYAFEKGVWKAVPGGKEPDQEALVQVMTFLLHLDCSAWVEKAKEGLEKWGLGDPPAGPTITLRLGKAGQDERTRTLVVGKTLGGGSHFARMSDGDLVFLLPDKVLRGAGQVDFHASMTGPWDRRPKPEAPKQEEPPKAPEPPKEPEKQDEAGTPK